ncbi:MAG: 30S ribosomal protein S6 [Candidatus Sungbacteria bacterium]|uniref:Small ribosomal subunit protein bS6 n=1 Tax=Candidatus Sungiibacteriota bacterium TaxID=2750080 RepID=A0A9D6LR66_9BACT|nr:30S ribosomal protein S6 [Candidatus Sungbacteria bacterium]
MDYQPKKYEIGYLVSPAVAEDDVARVTGIITRIIGELEGTIRHIKEPEKRRLAYYIENDRLAYFGYTTFSADPAALHEIEKKLKFEKEIMRSLIVEEVIEEKKAHPFRPNWRSTEGMARVEAPKREAEVFAKSDTNIENIDKRLDEILGS